MAPYALRLRRVWKERDENLAGITLPSSEGQRQAELVATSPLPSSRIGSRRIILGHDGPSLRCAWLAGLGDQGAEPLAGRDVDRRLAADDLPGPVGVGHHQPAHQRDEIAGFANLLLQNAFNQGTHGSRQCFQPLLSTLTNASTSC